VRLFWRILATRVRAVQWWRFVSSFSYLLLGAVIVLSVVYVAGDADAKAIVRQFGMMFVDLLRSFLHWLLQEVRTFVS
jgi:hypothetical protein